MTPNPAPPKSKTIWIIVGVVGAIGLCISGTLLAIAIPNFLKHRSKSKQAEATYTLKTLITAEEAFRAKEGTWATNPRQLVEYANSGPQHFTCFLGPDGRWGGKAELKFQSLPPDVQARLQENETAVQMQKENAGKPTGSDADFVLVCAMNLDDDPVLDIWSLTYSDPTPRHDVDDLAAPAAP
jgi:type II secretory pathway pseudopilin PulG